VRDYLWRWDTDWFWCSRAFGVQNPLVRRLVPRRYMRSDTWWRLVALEKRYRVMSRIERLRGLPEREEVVQDVEIPIDRLAEFMDAFARDIPIQPVWLCPLRQRARDAAWDLYRLDPDVLYVNVGFWSTVALEPGEDDSTHNRLVERLVGELDGRKSLYSTSFYSEEEFRELYGGAAYERLKSEYDPGGRLLDLYEKCVVGR
jgi:FAD/FMN-containing dehydrogenase